MLAGKEKRRGVVNCWGGKLAQTSCSDTGQCGFEIVRLMCLKLSMCLIILHDQILIVEQLIWLNSLSLYGYGSLLSCKMGASFSYGQAEICLSGEQDHPSAQPKNLSCNIQGHSPCQGSPPLHNKSVGIANPRISPLLFLLLTVESCVYFPMTSQEIHGNISRNKIYSFSYL